MKALSLFVLLSFVFIKVNACSHYQEQLENIFRAFDVINKELSKEKKLSTDTISNCISPEIVSLMYMIFNAEIKDIQAKEGRKIDSFPSYQFDIKNDFENFELPALKAKYLSASKYITFFSKPVGNFLIAEVFARDDNNSSNYKVVSMFGESTYFLFYFDSSNNVKYVRKMIMNNN